VCVKENIYYKLVDSVIQKAAPIFYG